MPVSTEDHASISQHLAKYCWTVDEIDGDGWLIERSENIMLPRMEP